MFFSFYVQLSSAVDQVLLWAQVLAYVDVLLCCGPQKSEERQDWKVEKGGKCLTCDPAATTEFSWWDKGQCEWQDHALVCYSPAHAYASISASKHFFVNKSTFLAMLCERFSFIKEPGNTPVVQAEIYNTANTDLFHNPQTIKNISVLSGAAFQDSLSLSHFQSWAKTASNNAKQAQFIQLKK